MSRSKLRKKIRELERARNSLDDYIEMVLKNPRRHGFPYQVGDLINLSGCSASVTIVSIEQATDGDWYYVAYAEQDSKPRSRIKVSMERILDEDKEND